MLLRLLTVFASSTKTFSLRGQSMGVCLVVRRTLSLQALPMRSAGFRQYRRLAKTGWRQAVSASRVLDNASYQGPGGPAKTVSPPLWTKATPSSRRGGPAMVPSRICSEDWKPGLRIRGRGDRGISQGPRLGLSLLRTPLLTSPAADGSLFLM